MWDWWDNTVDAVTDWAGDAWDKVNEVVDTYIWDTTENEAVVESWVRDTFNIPDQEGKGFASEAGEKITDLVDTYVRDTTEKEAAPDEWVQQMYDVPKQEGKGSVEDAWDGVKDWWAKGKEDADKKSAETDAAVGKVAETLFDDGMAPVEKGQILLGIGFDAAMAALGGMPEVLAQAFNINLENFVEDGLKLYAANKALVERIKVEEDIE